MRLTTRRNRVSRIALSAVLIVASLALSGCGLIRLALPHRPTPTPTEQTTGAGYTIEETSEGFVFTDAPSGYTVTFPQRPDVEPLANNESDQPANFASAHLTSSELATTGQVLSHAPDLRSQLLGTVQSLNPSGQINASSCTLGGLDAARAQFTTGESSEPDPVSRTP